MDSEQLRLWRQQLAEEESDEDETSALKHVAVPPRRTSQGPGAALGRGGAAPRAQLSQPSGDESMVILQHKLQVLQLQLEEKDIELQQARQMADMGGGYGGASPPGQGGPRDEKLKELAKRAKTATMALGRERAQNAQLAAELATVKRHLKEAGGAPSGTAGGSSGDSGGNEGNRSAGDGAALAKELKETKEKLAAANSRLHKENTAHQTVRAELSRCQRALAKEVGDDANVAKLLEDGSGAKGRAQQIALLREQLKELKAKLAAGGGGGDVGADVRADDRQRGTLHAMEVERRAEMERLLLREQQLEEEAAKAKRNLEAQAARIKILEADVKSKKEKLKMMLDKSDTDDKLVSALKEELAKLRGRAGGRKSDSGEGSPASKPSDADTERRVCDLSARVSQQQAQISRQEQIIEALRGQVEQAANREETLGAENSKLRELAELLQQKLRETAG